jgi:F420-dependent oxidoreductase-like protein
MKLGLELGEFAWDGGPTRIADTLGRLARSADSAGFSLIGVADHLWQGPHAGGPEQPMLECFTTLAALATHTENVRLAPIVAGVHLRAPALLAKTVTTLDVLSGGRAMLGIGTAWYEDEAHGMGIGYPSLTDRYGMLDEAVQICLRLWSGDETPFDGAHYQLGRPLNVPQALAAPRPPIMIAGGGEKRTLPLVAKYADVCNLYPTPDLGDKLATLRRLCDGIDRDYDSIEKTVVLPFSVGPDGEGAGELIEFLRGLAALGIETAIGMFSDSDPVRLVDIIGEKVLPAVADA